MDIKTTLGMTLPGEALLVAIINAASKNRETMSQENRDKSDALLLKISEDFYSVWRNFWTALGVLKS